MKAGDKFAKTILELEERERKLRRAFRAWEKTLFKMKRLEKTLKEETQT